MRRLTINRKKKLIACAMKVYIYLETKQDEDIILDGILCKKIGSIKNGKSISFDIPNEKCIVFVCFDRFLPDRFKTGYIVNSGEKDVVLYTYPKYNPFMGNPFLITKS